MESKNKIDIIIPAYKNQATIFRTLSSIAVQTIISDIEVTIVNDRDPNGDYKKFVDIFSQYFPIREIRTDKNIGKGLAMQKGIDETHNEYISFCYADDVYSGPFSLQILKKNIEKHGEKVKSVRSKLVSIDPDLNMIHALLSPHMIVGCLFRRSFLDNYQIRFLDSAVRAMEGVGFGQIISLLCDNYYEQELFLENTSYAWWHRKDSITDHTDKQFYLDQAFVCLVENHIYAVAQALKFRDFNDKIAEYISRELLYLISMQSKIPLDKPFFIEQSTECIKKYYHTLYLPYKDKLDSITKENIEKMGITATIGMHNTLEQLDQAEYNQEDIKEIWKRIPAKYKESNIKSHTVAEDFYD